MNSDVKKENALTLAAIIGTDQATAAELLSGSIGIFHEQAEPAGAEFARFLHELLRRTVEKVVLDPDDREAFDILVLINKTDRSGKSMLYVALGQESVTIGKEPLEESITAEGAESIWLLAAACYTAAQAVKCLVGDSLPVRSRSRLRIDRDSVFGGEFSGEVSFEIGNTYLAGAGAIGNAFVFALSLLKPSGRLHIADPDLTSSGNLNRCVWFGEDDVGHNKAKRLAELAQPEFENLVLIPHPVELQRVPARSEGAWLERLVVATDSRRTRRKLQNEIPREVFDASTTDIREIVLHFNRQPLGGLACLSCIYFQDEAEDAHARHVAEALGVTIEDVGLNFINRDVAEAIHKKYASVTPDEIEGLAYDSLFKRLCGEGRLMSAEDRQVFAPFAFVSVLAGTLLAVEFAKRVLLEDPVVGFNYWKLSPWDEPVTRLQRTRMARSHCEFCGTAIILETADSLWRPPLVA